MSFKSVLDKIGADAKGVFAFLASPKGQVIVGAEEAAVEAFVPGATGLINLANIWLTEAVKTETLAVAAGSAATGNGAQKAALTIAAVGPQAAQFAAANGLPSPTSAQLTAANNALVAFANAFTVPAAPAV